VGPLRERVAIDYPKGAREPGKESPLKIKRVSSLERDLLRGFGRAGEGRGGSQNNWAESAQQNAQRTTGLAAMHSDTRR